MSDIYKKLIADFGPEALSVDKSRGFALTSIKAQYVRERLNEVLGFDGWIFTGTYEDKGDAGVLFFGQLGVKMELPDGEFGWHKVEGVGFSHVKKNVGDTYKSAATDALSKAASVIGVGNEVYKGNVSADAVEKVNSPGKVSKPTPSQPAKRSSFNKPGATAPVKKGFGK